MSSINLVFHALAEEQILIIQQWLMQSDVSTVLLYITPSFKAFKLPDNNSFSRVIKSLGIPTRICLGLQPLDITASSLYEFMRDNPDCCVIDIGELTPDGLRESQLSLSTNNSTHLKFWSGLVGAIRKATTAGLWAINPNTGEKDFYKQNRYTKGAAELAKTGKKLLPVAGWNYYQIKEP